MRDIWKLTHNVQKNKKGASQIELPNQALLDGLPSLNVHLSGFSVSRFLHIANDTVCALDLVVLGRHLVVGKKVVNKLAKEINRTEGKAFLTPVVGFFISCYGVEPLEREGLLIRCIAQ